MQHSLDVYLHGIFAGKLIQSSADEYAFQYDPTYVEEKRQALSVSLPLSDAIYKGQSVKAYFSGILPDDVVRRKIARYLGVSEKNTFSLLETVGGECAGALSLFPEGKGPSTLSEYTEEPIDEVNLKDLLSLLEERPLLAGEEGLRLSLAGAQEKIALKVYNDQYFLPLGDTPSTHIIKPLIKGISESVYNELFCMRLAKSAGFDVPFVDVKDTHGVPYFIVERYDRSVMEGKVIRLHQEDFCQALGVMPEHKYEREGGPSIMTCMDLIRGSIHMPAKYLLDFQKRLIFNFLIGNADAHGKNYSILYREPNKPTLAPVYDVLSTACYKTLSKKMAMKMGGKYDPNYIMLKNWHSLVPDTNLAQKTLEKTLKKISEKVLDEAVTLKEKLTQEGKKSDIYDRIISIISSRRNNIIEGINP